MFEESQKRTSAAQFQDYMVKEIQEIFDRLENVNENLRVSIAAYSKAEVENSILIALDSLMKPARDEVGLLIADVNKARVQHANDAAIVRKELLRNNLDSKHLPQEDFSMKSFYWSMTFAFITFIGGGYLGYLLKS